MTPAIAWTLHRKVGVDVVALRLSPPSRPSRQCQCQIRLLASGCGGEHGSAPRSGSDSPSPSRRDLFGPHRETGRQGRLIGLRSLCSQKSWAGCLELAAGCRAWPRHAPPQGPQGCIGEKFPCRWTHPHDVPNTFTDPSDPSITILNILIAVLIPFGHGSRNDGGGDAGLVAQLAGRWGACPRQHMTRRGRFRTRWTRATCHHRNRTFSHGETCWEALLGTPSACGKKTPQPEGQILWWDETSSRLQGQSVSMRLLCRQAEAQTICPF